MRLEWFLTESASLRIANSLRSMKLIAKLLGLLLHCLSSYDDDKKQRRVERRHSNVLRRSSTWCLKHIQTRHEFQIHQDALPNKMVFRLTETLVWSLVCKWSGCATSENLI